LSLAEVTLLLKQSMKLSRYVLCGGVAAAAATLARLKCKLPDDVRGPKHVGAILI
jgi:hypothetical protein